MSKLAITLGKGFQITFANGATASVQWGRCNYCERRGFEEDGPEHIRHDNWESSKKEVI